ncbi:hypothetical protein T265_03440 [Opisthorchis viverrini]|uniref:Uncharacterized protein n=1 Tax=Opisthorchis viverrini TaxID=6198 RepID=A0A074ZSG9_OPIVI|nr:hypothetical protein T265_03440 [Opisthorchis viverrini]KER30071.1 hypothetical protein T265_03440 [Opisthorchis viverrini]
MHAKDRLNKESAVKTQSTGKTNPIQESWTTQQNKSQACQSKGRENLQKNVMQPIIATKIKSQTGDQDSEIAGLQ